MNLGTQWLTMGLMLSSGLILGVFLDFYRVLTIRFRLRGWIISLIDLLYWVVSAGLVFGLLFWSNWGEMRFYFFVAVGVGFLLYFRWFSRTVTKMIRLFLYGMERLLFFCFRILRLCLWVPLLSLWQLAIVVLRFALQVIRWLLMPFLWLARPLYRPVQRWLEPCFIKGRNLIQRGKRWWNKIRAKGG
ncbi:MULTISPECIES: spore cortex biosynthesis protein YabQ [Thermoactinomyces]|uniref:Spore cortex biosynthesis protein YabQ n=1 Tax=Thermoactinomyces daqus TaxID=1329516 RepID=A0A7W1X9B6_9BACL|nr:spore cortex biosynthesis protein YabQ [Thermoactinomyces daqus]MBA4542436.1 spore cortex biosynthesis protein YabQ [Thermoactinomyces daqus]MBH8598775.1 spore cortex biosynthesis protein YabQ [Thermoactinomyces sp. CICC 10523]MBH8604760.1 spore cortex biosynthesis protein YabQ [Thermoactinomyces sp. CICC 10522]MBH8607414.1 spore cortex biosynthesis protein YabQ [Thermoactinomyces sp. CICC 10521]